MNQRTIRIDELEELAELILYLVKHGLTFHVAKTGAGGAWVVELTGGY